MRRKHGNGRPTPQLGLGFAWEFWSRPDETTLRAGHTRLMRSLLAGWVKAVGGMASGRASFN